MVTRQFSPDDLPSVQADVRPTRRKPPPLPLSLEMRVFRGVFYALLAFSLLSAVGYAIRLVIARAAVQQAMDQFAEQAQQSQEQLRAESYREEVQRNANAQYRLQQAALERSRYVLANDQRCVGGAVIQVDGNSYTQLGSISQPVHCTGQVADRPLR